jgi:hypothetical protein
MLGFSDAQNSENSKNIFSDVDKGSAVIAELAIDLGILNNLGNGVFMPEDTVTYDQAIKTMVNAIGYGVYAKETAGTLSSYMSIAANKKIINNISVELNKPLTRGDMMNLFFNTLKADMLIQTSFSEDGVYKVESGKNLLTEKLKIQHKKGLVGANQYTSLASLANLTDNKVMISGEQFYVGNTNASDFLGLNVDFYVKEDEVTNDNTIVSIEPDETKNKVTIIDADEIDDILSEQIKYHIGDDEGKVLSKNISKNANVIYNGVYYGVKRLVSDNILMPLVGNLKLVDSNADGVIDTIFVTKYDTYVVNRTYSTDSRVDDKLGNKLYLSTDNATINIFKIDDPQTQIPFTKMKEWNVLSVAQSENTTGKKLINVILSTDWVGGQVDSQSENEVTIKEKTYIVSEGYSKIDSHSLICGDKGTFYIDFQGKIAGANLEGNKGYNYAYLVGAENSKGISSNAKFKLYTAKGEMVICEGTDNIKWADGTTKKPDEAVDALKEAGVVKSQLIKYEINSAGKLSKLIKAVDNTAIDKYAGFDKEHFSFDENVKSSTNRIYKVYLNSKYILDNNTVIFDIPADKTKTDKFAVKKRGSYALDDKSLPAHKVYDVSETFVPGALVLEGGSGVVSVSDESPTAIIEKKTISIDEDGNSVYGIYFLGQRTAIFTDSINLQANNSSVWIDANNTVQDVSQLQAGDMIQYVTNSSGKIAGFRLLFRASSPGVSREFANNQTSIPEYDILMSLYVAYGEVVAAKGNNFVLLTKNGDKERRRALSMNVDITTKVSIYYTNSKKIKRAKADDVRPEDKICIRNYFAQMFDVIIIRSE